MKTKKLFLLAALSLAMLSCSGVKTDGILTPAEKEGDYILLTNELTQGEEFHGHEEHNIPLRIYLSQGKVTKIEAYDYLESPEYFADLEAKLLGQYDGLTIQDALNKEVDAISGATESSTAVLKSIRVGLEYAKSKGL